jgi:hypothetical protein
MAKLELRKAYGRFPMKDLLIDFLKSPDRESYLSLRDAVVSSDQYEPYSFELEEVGKLLDAGELTEARERISASMPNLLLSPRAHLML